MRAVAEVGEEVLSRGGRYQEVCGARRESKAPAPLKVKEVFVEDRPYVVCHNEEEAEKDRADREAIVASLQDRLRRGDKSLVGNKGYRKFLKTLEGPRFAIDDDKVLHEARFHGKWVLQTDTDLPAEKVALKYKELWMVEAAFRSIRSVLETRRIYHKRDACPLGSARETIRGHVFCSFLALMLLKDLQTRMEDGGRRLEWERLRDDLCHPKPNSWRCRESPPSRRCSPRTHRPTPRSGKHQSTKPLRRNAKCSAKTKMQNHYRRNAKKLQKRTVEDPSWQH
jgi:hypothetical protein